MKYLTPKQVLELLELGVKFTNTFLIYVKDPSTKYYDLVFCDDIDEDFEGEWIPCPSLQEILEILPSHIGMHYLSYHKDEAWFMEYTEILESYIANKNVLILAFNMLKWVATEHPEQLKK